MATANTIAQVLAFLNPTTITDPYSWVVNLVHDIFGSAPRVIAEVSVPLTAAATTPLFTVPAGYRYEHDDVALVGVTAQSGGTSTTLKINDGTSQLLNGSTGHVFISGTATSLLAAGAKLISQNLYPPATMSVAPVQNFAAGTVINAVTSGTVVTAGAVKVQLIGKLVRV